MKKIFILTLVLFLGIVLYAYDNVYSDIETALKISEIEEKITIMVFSSKSCVYCDKLRDETFNDQRVVDLFNAGYNVVEIFPEDKDVSFIINDQEINSNYLQLSSIFGVRGTPSMFFVNSSNQILTNVPGFVPADSFIPILQFLGSGAYLTTDYQTFSSNSSDYIGQNLIIETNEEDSNYVLENDKNSINYKDAEENIDVYKTIIVDNKNIADELIEKGVYRVLLNIE